MPPTALGEGQWQPDCGAQPNRAAAKDQRGPRVAGQRLLTPVLSDPDLTLRAAPQMGRLRPNFGPRGRSRAILTISRGNHDWT